MLASGVGIRFHSRLGFRKTAAAEPFAIRFVKRGGRLGANLDLAMEQPDDPLFDLIEARAGSTEAAGSGSSSAPDLPEAGCACKAASGAFRFSGTVPLSYSSSNASEGRQ